MNNRNFSKAVEAVSPVVATLLLVLVAAGAAIGFGVFLNGFQKKTQSNVSSETPAETLHIGGSSTVFELTEKALPVWKAAHPSIVIDDQEGGSDAGLIAICKGNLDIGASSKAFPASGNPSLQTCPDFNNDGVKDAGKDMQQFVVGYDGVAIAFGGTTHCTSMSITQAQVKELYLVNGGGVAGTNGVILATAPTAGSFYTWNDLVTAGICTGAGGAQTVLVGSRSDNSGTEDGFCNKVLGLKKDGTHCTNDANDQMIDSFFSTANAKTFLGNDGIGAALDSTPDLLSFVGFGTVATDSNLHAAKLGACSASGLGGVSAPVIAACTADNRVAPSAASIKAAGADAATLAKDKACDGSVYLAPSGEYCAVRPLEYVTAGAPSATEQLFLDFMLQTLNNVNFNKAAGYVSIYS